MTATPQANRQRIRPAKEADLPACAELLREWLASAADMAVGQTIDLDFDHEGELRHTMEAEDEAFFVAEDEDGVQGFITLRGHSRRNGDFINRAGSLARRMLSRRRMRAAPDRRVGVIDHVIVRPGKRNNYMSLALFKAVAEWCADHGLIAIEGTVWAANTRVLRVSERVGFNPVRVLIRKELD